MGQLSGPCGLRPLSTGEQESEWKAGRTRVRGHRRLDHRVAGLTVPVDCGAPVAGSRRAGERLRRTGRDVGICSRVIALAGTADALDHRNDVSPGQLLGVVQRQVVVQKLQRLHFGVRHRQLSDGDDQGIEARVR